MIKQKLYKIILLFVAFSLTQCYTDPFFTLTVEIVDQNLNPVENVNIVIEATDVDNGTTIDGSIIFFEGITNNQGVVEFDFENKAFVSARACITLNDINMCKEGHIYLEANTNKNLTLMIDEGDCIYCY
ncbi:MAG: hypothetical protein CMP49_00385 [Flavobacteriales bacterium]|jgi:hypothetical protein|nr:hypothetical protein [Flavobacteriales bacterium]|tara:strand:+ start:6655 stop:7041 length:387 start_codon:yes stop_codon:yes gene_type:complete